MEKIKHLSREQAIQELLIRTKFLSKIETIQYFVSVLSKDKESR